MKHSRFVIAVFLCLFCTNLSAQKEYSVQLEKTINLESVQDGLDIDLTYELLFPNKIYKKNKEYLVVPPKSDKPLAYALADFRNSPQGIKNHWAYFISNFDQDFPLFYFDHNNNLDFTDDGAPVSYGADSLLSFFDGKLKARFLPFSIAGQDRVLIKFIKKKDEKDISGQILMGENEKTIHSKFWPNELIANQAKGLINIDGESYTIAIYDFDEDNKFGTKRDLLFTGTLDSQGKNYWEFRKGNFRLGEKSFSIKSSNSNGSEITIVEDPSSSAPEKFNIGDKLDDLSVKTLSKEISLSSIYKNYKYTLLDFWATWCKPCIAAMPELEQLKEEYQDVGIIGFAADKRHLIQKFEDKYPHSWTNVIVPEKLEFQFNILGLPTYYIIDAAGEIIEEFKTVNQVRKFLSEH